MNIKKRITNMLPKVNIFSKTNKRNKVNKLNRENYAKIIDKFAIILRDIKIRNRLMLAFAISLLIPILVISLFSINFSSRVIKSKVSGFSSQEINLISKNIQSMLDNKKVEILSLTVASDFQANLVQYDSMNESSRNTFINILKESILKKYMTDEKVTSVVIADKTGKLISGKGYNSAFADKQINSKANAGGKVVINAENISDDSTKPIPGINMFREIKSSVSGNVIGYFWVNYKEDILFNIYKNNIIGNDTNLMIIDVKGNVVSSKNKTEINKVYNSKTLITSVVDSSKAKTINIGNKSYFVSSSKVEGYDWNLVNMIATSYLNQEASVIKYSIIAIAILEFLVAIFIAYIISNSISKPLNKIMISIEKAKEGTIKASNNDLNEDEVGEVSRSFNDMMENLSSLIGNTKDTSAKISNGIQSIVQVAEQSLAASEEIAATMSEVSTGAQSQAEGMSTTIIYLNKLSDGINLVETSLGETLEVIHNTEEMGEETKTAIIFLKEKSKDTKGVSVKIFNNINELSNYMNQIGNIAKLIVGISEQTNLLALNASIEAARVGDAGRGFTIVAEQVKKLAIQSKDASSKIDKIIGQLTRKISFITKSASKTQGIIVQQDEAIEETNSSALSIITSMKGVSNNIDELVESVKEIYVLKGETVNSMEGINAVSEETAATTEEVTATTQDQIVDMENLSGAATNLNEMIKKLNNAMEMFTV